MFKRFRLSTLFWVMVVLCVNLGWYMNLRFQRLQIDSLRRQLDVQNTVNLLWHNDGQRFRRLLTHLETEYGWSRYQVWKIVADSQKMMGREHSLEDDS